MQKALVLILLVTSVILLSCNSNQQNEIVGSWTGSNDNGHNVKIEFTKNGEYHLSLISEDGSKTQLSDFSIINYRFDDQKDPSEITLFDGESKQEFAKLKASFPSQNKLALTLFDVSLNEKMDQIELSRN